jgi:kumamolisin
MHHKPWAWASLVALAVSSACGVTAAEAAPGIPAVIASGVRDVGPAPAGTRVDFSVVLPYRNASDLPLLLQAQQNPVSKLFRHFLSAAEFRAYFSPTQADYDAAAARLSAAGFTVERFANRTVLHASGAASAAQAFFHTHIDALRQADGRVGYGNVTGASVPAGLAGARVLGLNSVGTVELPGSRRVGSPRRTPAAAGPLFGPDGGFGPLAIAKAENFPFEHGYRGTNSNVADLIDGAVSDSDVASFLHAFGLQRSGPRTTRVAIDGGCSQGCADGFVAVADAEWILGVAPGASLFTYEVPTLSNAALVVDGLNAIASDDAVNIVNLSFGMCELAEPDLELSIEPIVAQGAAEGITFEAVAFGGASLCPDAPLVLPMAPANLDTLTAVGASSTIVDLSGKQLAQSTFQDSNGGVSVVISRPAWQTATRGTKAAGRNVPDVVIPGIVDDTGPSIYFAGLWEGGFSFVNNAPFAGYLAGVQEMYGYGTRLGNIAPALYAVLNRYGYHAGSSVYFSDVTLGDIGTVSGVPVSAKPGYDIASGIGSVGDGYTLAKAFAFGPLEPPSR